MRTYQPGFSAVELLITLFVGAAFIATGYQVYSLIIQNSGDARVRAKASSIAYDTLRTYSPQATTPCSVVTPTPTPTIPANSGLSHATIAVSISCPYGTQSPTSKVQVTLTFSDPQQEIVHATYVTE
jgi:Tfp pilus assembly protein PilE